MEPKTALPAAVAAAKLSAANAARLARVSEWYASARFGIFYHYGIYTGGGCATSEGRYASELVHKTVEDFEAAAPEPRTVARNLAAAAKDVGARYATLTVTHTCGGQVVLFPSKRPEFLHKTRQDFIGPFLEECRAADVMPMLYIPNDCNNWDNPQTGPNMAEDVGRDNANPDNALYGQALKGLVEEIHARYGDLPAGFWIDGGLRRGCRSVPPRIRELWPRAVIVGNGCDSLQWDDIDYGTTECLADGEKCDPPYNRPGGYRKLNAWGQTTPRTDFNEDIPTPNGWWFQGENVSSPYANDRFFLLRQMICALGLRGLWNFHPGIGPRIDGTMPNAARPSLDAIRDFLSWAGEAIYGTRGPAGTPFTPGWMNVNGSVAFCSVTVRLDNPDVCYAIFTEAPERDYTMLETSGLEPRRITDLRSGRDVPFTMWAGPLIEGIDWTDIPECGAKVFKLEF